MLLLSGYSPKVPHSLSTNTCGCLPRRHSNTSSSLLRSCGHSTASANRRDLERYGQKSIIKTPYVIARIAHTSAPLPPSKLSPTAPSVNRSAKSPAETDPLTWPTACAATRTPLRHSRRTASLDSGRRRSDECCRAPNAVPCSDRRDRHCRVRPECPDRGIPGWPRDS